MAGKQSRVPKSGSPPTADDFLLIRGIGPALAKRLHDAGIRTFAQLASRSPTKLAAQVSGLSIKQLTSQDWRGQARTLARKKQPGAHRKEKAIPVVRQHYENFTIECLLDERNRMRRTRVVHIQSGDADAWAGWASELLLSFLARHMNLPNPEPPLASQEIVNTDKSDPSSGNGESIPAVIAVPNAMPLSSEQAQLSPFVQNRAIFSQPAQASGVAGTLHLRTLKVIPVDSDDPIFFLQQGQPYRLQITLDLANIVAPDAAPLLCEATILFKQLDGPGHAMCDASQTLRISDSFTLVLDGSALDSGLYRLNAFVRLVSDASPTGLKVALTGDLLQVY